MSGTTRTVPIELVSTLVDFAEERGWVVHDMLASAGVSPTLLRSDRARVTEDQLVALVQHVWRVTDDEMFGIARHPLPRGTFRLLCYALLGAPDLRDALARLDGFLRAIPAIPLEVHPRGTDDDVALVLTLGPRTAVDQLGVIIGLSASSRLLAWMLKRNVTARRIELPFEAPADVEPFEVLLDGPLVFGAGRAAVVLDSSWLSAPVMRDESDVEELVSTSPRALLTKPRYQLTVGEQVRRLVESGLRNGSIPTADEIAARLTTSPQTLRRHLAEEGLNVRELTEDVRRDAAIAGLVDGDESVAELADRLGFSEPSAFVRAFRRWTGSTPGTYRREGRSAR